MQVTLPYRNLEHTLKSLKIQVVDSLPFLPSYIPSYIQTPQELFSFLKSKVNYTSDPKNTELLQMVPTLMERGGRGDCDCFTILTLAACHYLNFKPTYVALVGRSVKTPSHIYSEVYDPIKKKICAMDLTNPVYCMERNYNYKQRLNFVL